MSGPTGRALPARPAGQTQFVRGTRNLVALAVILIGAAGAPAAGPTFIATGLTAPAKDPLPPNKLDAVTVTFDAHPTKMVFRAPWQVTLDLGRGVRYGNAYAETLDNKNCQGCCEVCQDGRQQYSRMWIAHRSPARIVVRWRAALADKNGRVAHTDVPSGSPHGQGDWVDEWYTIYPDATHVRLVRIYTGLAPRAAAHWGRPGRHPFETQESTVFGPPGHQPIDDIDVGAVTVIAMDGRRTLGYDRTQKAYVVRKTALGAGPLDLTIQAAKGSASMNPAFVVKGWSGAEPVVTVDGQVRAPGKDLRIGLEKTDDSADLVIWLGRTFTRPVRIEIRPPLCGRALTPVGRV